VVPPVVQRSSKPSPDARFAPGIAVLALRTGVRADRLRQSLDCGIARGATAGGASATDGGISTSKLPCDCRLLPGVC
jgi:hypothetical protein